MKTNALSQLSAFAMSAVFATVATFGVAVLMTSSGEQVRTQFSAGTAVQSNVQAAANLNLSQAPAV